MPRVETKEEGQSQDDLQESTSHSFDTSEEQWTEKEDEKFETSAYMDFEEESEQKRRKVVMCHCCGMEFLSKTALERHLEKCTK